eukprot:TRINITY_DN33874_c0_g1_i1.p1 TRINITY_DN33874_c0_g1~~TRINITY_DN33874_c0_g1_i1.p1  ORF type:complete len:273 (+),score=-0.97 TRINITY_DN33874_c0_g1_i1:283-1101(+)
MYHSQIIDQPPFTLPYPLLKVDVVKIFVQIISVLFYPICIGAVVFVIIGGGEKDMISAVTVYYGVKLIIATSILQATCNGYKIRRCTAAMLHCTVFFDIMITIIFVLAAFDEEEDVPIFLIAFKGADLLLYGFIVCAWTEEAQCSICPWMGRERPMNNYAEWTGFASPARNGENQGYVMVPVTLGQHSIITLNNTISRNVITSRDISLLQCYIGIIQQRLRVTLLLYYQLRSVYAKFKRSMAFICTNIRICLHIKPHIIIYTYSQQLQHEFS